MKDAVLTVRLPGRLRQRIERRALKEGRSLSSQVERLCELALGATVPQRLRPTGGVLKGGRVPTLAEFRQVRRDLSSSLLRRPLP